MIESLNVKRNVDAKIPPIPNFILVGKESISISDFSKDELGRIAECWKQNLIEKAQS